ncbi:MAG: hypothetical protein WCL06_07765 [Bacteroidota bacterium]
MKKIIIFIPLLLLLLLIISCNGKKVEKQIAKIDSLAKIMDSVDQKLKLINHDTIVNRYHTYQITLDTLSKHFKEVKTDVSFKYLCAYQEVRKPFKTMSFSYGVYKTEIDSTIKQLNDLKHDVKEKLISDKEFETFFMNECNSVNAVFCKVSKNVDNVLLQMKNYDTVHPYLTKLINNHKSGKKTSK